MLIKLKKEREGDWVLVRYKNSRRERESELNKTTQFTTETHGNFD